MSALGRGLGVTLIWATVEVRLVPVVCGSIRDGRGGAVESKVPDAVGFQSEAQRVDKASPGRLRQPAGCVAWMSWHSSVGFPASESCAFF